jgi:hypothetical protein
MAVVDTIYNDFRDSVSILAKAGEVSLQIMLESNLRKTLLLCAASYFEYTLSREVELFASEIASGNDLIGSLIRSKAITRQYHTWFDWERDNANKFFSLFGPVFKDHMRARIDEVENLEDAIKSFMEIGRERNQLVHSDYASFSINKTPDEIYTLYLSADVFVKSVGVELHACSAKLAART